MCNFSISVSKGTRELFLVLWGKFEENFGLFKNVVIVNTDDDIKLVFSMQEKKKEETKELVKAWISDSLVLYYKSVYLENNLKIPNNLSVPFKALCKALAVFDKLSDVSFVLKNLELTEELNLNSFYLFKLGELRLRWQEICDLFYSNLPELIASNAFIDLMRYLLSVSEPLADKVHVKIDDNFIYLKDDNGVNIIKPLPNTRLGEENLILELITLSPSSIHLEHNKDAEKISKEIKYLFSDKVVYCT